MESLFDKLVTIYFKKQSKMDVAEEEQEIWDRYHAEHPPKPFELKEEDLLQMGAHYRNREAEWKKFKDKYFNSDGTILSLKNTNDLQK